MDTQRVVCDACGVEIRRNGQHTKPWFKIQIHANFFSMNADHPVYALVKKHSSGVTYDLCWECALEALQSLPLPSARDKLRAEHRKWLQEEVYSKTDE